MSSVEQKETEKTKNSETDPIISAGRNEFNVNITQQLASVGRYGLNIFNESMEYTKQLLMKQEEMQYKEISKDYEIINNDSLKHMIPTDIDHIQGQIL